MKAEYMTIGFILEYSRLDYLSKINADWFGDPMTRYLFESIKSISTEREDINAEDLKTYLHREKRQDAIGRLNRILTAEYIYPGNLDQLLHESYQERAISGLKRHMDSRDATLESTITAINETGRRLVNDIEDSRMFHMDDLVGEYIEAKEKGIPNRLQKRTMGLSNYALSTIFDGRIYPFVYGIGARPGFHKTDFLINLMCDFYNRGHDGVFFSFEDNRETLRNKFLAVNHQITKKAVNDFVVPERKMEEIKENRRKAKIVVFERRLNVDGFRHRVDQLFRTGDYRYILVDYIQLFKMGKGKRHEEMGQITKEFMDIANTYMVPVIFTSQVNQRDESSDGNVSLDLGDFKESGDIEADVRMAILLQGRRSDTWKTANIAKNTWGRVREIEIEFHLESGHMTGYRLPQGG